MQAKILAIVTASFLVACGPAGVGGSSTGGSSSGGSATTGSDGSSLGSTSGGASGSSSAGSSSGGAATTTCGPGAFLHDGACATLTACSPQQFQSAAPTATSNRVCAPITVCVAGQYESAAPTATSDRVCLPVTACDAEHYQSAAATPTTDATCTALTTCSTDQYQTVAATATSDRACASLSTCTAQQYQSVAPTATTNRVCTALRVCGAQQYQSVAATATTDRVCAALTTCTAQQYETAAPTATSDRGCTALTTCTNTQYQSTAPTAISDRGCTDISTCTTDQYQSAAPTTTSDRLCLAISTCTSLQYQTAPPTTTRDRGCTDLTVCSPLQYQSVPPTATSNRTCATLATCNTFQYESTPPTATSNRGCTNLSECDFSQYESTAPTATSDRKCTSLTLCGSAQCESVPPTAVSDRQCGPQSLVVSPTGLQTLSATTGQAKPYVTFFATVCGAPVNAAWTIDKGALGAFDETSSSTPTFTASATLGGLGTITAGYTGLTASAQVLVQIANGQNGSTAAESGQVPTTVAALTAGGGVGGVGGEGLGTVLANDDPNYVALLAGATDDGSSRNLKYLYPYDATVWPRGMLAPLLQWDWSMGDADAIRIDLSTTTGSFAWTGYFGKPAILATPGLASSDFIRHPIPQDVWQMATDTAGDVTVDGSPDQLTVAITLAKAGTAYGPIKETWSIARARLSGTIYYQSYGTNLAANYGPGTASGSGDGALDLNNASGSASGSPLKSKFGAAVLSIRGGDPTPKLVSSYSAQCQVCHSVAAKGARLLVQGNGAGSGVTEDYELASSGITTSQLTHGIGGDGYPGLYPDGSLMLSPNGTLQSLVVNTTTHNADNTSTVTTSGLSTYAGNLGVPAFSPDGTKVVFNAQDSVTHPGRELTVMSFDKVSAFSSPIVVSDDYKSTGDNTDVRPTWAQFFPDSNSIIYEHQVRTGLDGNTGDGYTRKFTQGQIYWASAIASASVTPLNKLNGLNSDGTSYLPHLTTASTVSCTADGQNVGANATALNNGVPNGDPAHLLDKNYNYEPTVNPVSSGGYAWVVFTSRRMYGNEANIPPYCSDPRGLDLHANMTNNTNVTTKKLWVAAIDINGNPATDASHPAFYLPAQELLAGNARGFWVLDPCKADNVSCLTGDQCCGGYCEPTGAGGALQCSNTLPDGACSPLQGGCTSPSDCCLSSALCVGGFCASPSD